MKHTKHHEPGRTRLGSPGTGLKENTAQHLEAAAKVRRVSWLGLLVNIGLSVLKVSGGYFGNSRAVLADGVHSLTDCLTDLMVIVGSYTL